ncbi:MAG: EamA family transporter, partial [Arenimonas sp.]
MSSIRTFTLTLLAMIAFAGNSLLCRLALKNTTIDAASFTGIRLFSGALVLLLLMGIKNGKSHSGKTLQGDWLSALALFAYAVGFSFAYQNLSAATGALLLFSAVQASMIIYAIGSGERFRPLQL